MFERFTERARQVVVLAQEEARTLRHSYIGTEHILLGLLREDEGLAAHVLFGFDITAERVRAQVVRIVPPGEKIISGQIPFSENAKQTLDYSLTEAPSLGHNYVGTEHLLLGLLQAIEKDNKRETVAGQILRELDADTGLIRKEVVRMLSPLPPRRTRRRSEGSTEPPTTPRRPAGAASEQSPATSDHPRQGSSGQDSSGQVPASAVPPAAPEQPLGLEMVPTHSDRPATEDELGRARLAEVLAERIRRVRGEDTERPVTNRGERRRKLREDRRAAAGVGSFMIHVHAPWGAGKSSFLNFLAVNLRNSTLRTDRGRLGTVLDRSFGRRSPATPALSQWIVVEFNAWEHQRLAPPWWWLLATIRRSCASELWRIGRGRWTWFWIRDVCWRLWNSRAAWVTVMLLVALAVIAKALNWFGLEHSSLSTLKATAVSVSVLLAAGTAIWGRIHGTSRWLAVGSAEGAAKFLKRAHDPLGVYRRRFGWLVRSAGRPIVVFIDDLDRCKPEYVVELLEGIQTLFSEGSVTYVVAADRTWLCESFAKVYCDFKEAVGEPGRPLGFLFLEKTFQVSMEIPPLSSEDRRRYWRSLTSAVNGGSAADGRDGLTVRPRFDLTEAFASAETHTQIESQISSLVDAGANEEDVLRAAVRKLNAPSLQAQLESLLREFAELLEGNPRSMKRLVNAYGIERDRLLREGRLPSPEERKQLVLFTILRLRWPLLADYLLTHPEDAELVGNGGPPEGNPLAALFGDREVRALFDCSRVKVKLDAKILAGYSGRDSAQPPSVGA